MTTELSIRPDQGKFDDTQRAALESLGISDAPEGDQQLFLHVAQRSGLDPFARQIYLIPRWDGKTSKNKWTIQTSIDGLRVIRDRIGKFQGLVTEWCGSDGVWKDVWLSDKKPAAARVSVYVTGFQVPIRGIALWSEYVQTTKQGSITAMWNGKSTLMIAKCAEAIAYRQAFPQDFSGLYVAEEMPAAGVDQDHDGLNVRETMRAATDAVSMYANFGRKPDTVGKTEERQRDAGDAASERQTTPAPAQRPGRPRTDPVAGTAGQVATNEFGVADTRDRRVVAEEWFDRITGTIDLGLLYKLHDEAATRGVLNHSDGNTTVEDFFVERRTELQQETAPASEAVYDPDELI